MKGIRLLPVILMLPFMTGVCAISVHDGLTSSPDSMGGDKVDGNKPTCYMEPDDIIADDIDTESDEDTTTVWGHIPVPIPSFVKSLLDYADWWADTICVVDGTAYYWAYEDYGRCNVIFNKDKVLLAAPVLCIDSFALDCDTKFYVSNAGKSVLVDFSDKKTLKRLKSLSQLLPSFTRYRKDSIAGFGRTVFYSFAVDFPTTSIPHSNHIRKWLVKIVESSQSLDEDIPGVSSIYIGYSKRPYGGWAYSGNISDNSQVARFATNLYFAIKKEEYGTNPEDYPSTLFADLNLQAMVYNKRYVTYQEYTHDYNGGAHGFYTERLVSYDHVHQQEIDYDYLFKPNCKDEVLTILLDEAKKTPQYKEWEPNIMYYVKNQDEDGIEKGELNLPTPGLSKDGVVFSFQPYSISCFAAGPFHFTIPHKRLSPYFTERAKWCFNIK